MHAVSKIALALAGLALASQAAAQVTFYERDGFRGRSFTVDRPVENLDQLGFNDRASSVVVQGQRWERWEVCEDRGFRGRCVVLRPGEYPTLAALGLNDRISSLRAVDRDADAHAAPAPAGRIDLFENEGFQGRRFTADQPVEDFRRVGFNDRASSAVVSGERWQVCEDARYGGRCVVLRPGEYPSLTAMGLNDRISSVRAVEGEVRGDDGRGPPAERPHDYRRRDSERVFDAPVTAVRAVVEDSGQRCWVEREQVPAERSTANVPGVLLGAVIGGILGHQVGGGTGRDVATGVGAVAGAVIGGNVGQSGPATQDVQRCAKTPGPVHPAYWDVTYRFRGQDHHVQMTTPPGASVTVNDEGEPRV